MADEFLFDDESKRDADNYDRPGGNRGDREPVRITVSGSQQNMTRIIHQLYSLGFAQIHEWSKPQRYPQTGKLFCVMTKYLPPE